jgi:peptidoglycan hydrolase-like protein with peptidoglycan-binding domain
MKFSRRLVTVCIALLSILSLVLPQLTAASASFSQNLQLRDTGDDVSHLQQFLNAQKYLVAQSGPGSPGNETSIFGLHTYQALTQFQSAHGLPTTGFFGPLTRAFISTLAARSTATSTSPSSVGTSTVAAPQPPAVAPAFSPFASTTSGYIPGVTPLPGYAPGQLIFIGGGASTPAPATTPEPAPYVAHAVHFNNTTPGSVFLQRGPLIGVTDSPVGLVSFWTNYPNAAEANIFQNTLNDIQLTVQYAPGTNNMFVVLYDLSNNNNLDYQTDANTLFAGRWNNVIISWDTNHDAGSRVVQVVINGVLVHGAPINTGDIGSAFNVELASGGYDYLIGGDVSTSPFTGGVADFYFKPGGSFTDLSIAANRRPFITADLKPADPSGFPSGAAILMSGDANNFPNNQGTGGPFTLHGTLTNADTSPSN